MRRMLPRIMTLDGPILKKPFGFSSDTDQLMALTKVHEHGLAATRPMRHGMNAYA